jgi:hypothetical protein
VCRYPGNLTCTESSRYILSETDIFGGPFFSRYWPRFDLMSANSSSCAIWQVQGIKPNHARETDYHFRADNLHPGELISSHRFAIAALRSPTDSLNSPLIHFAVLTKGIKEQCWLPEVFKMSLSTHRFGPYSGDTAASGKLVGRSGHNNLGLTRLLVDPSHFYLHPPHHVVGFQMFSIFTARASFEDGMVNSTHK